MTEQRGTDWRKGDWMQTYTGRAFWPMDARPEEVDRVDIAHALAHLCRYGGHVKRFYSVAEHCWLMSYAVAPENALYALLHDSTEAYMVDLPRPVKRSFPEYSAAEDRLWLVIAEHFGVDPKMPAEVKDVDNRILMDERAALMKPPPMPWKAEEDNPKLGVQIRAWEPRVAEQMYLHRLRQLLGEDEEVRIVNGWGQHVRTYPRLTCDSLLELHERTHREALRYGQSFYEVSQ